jgi:glycosyltransferase involved in cell wall biosynthesis
MKIVLVHNFYQQAGGEDAVFEQERRLLECAGHDVIVYCRSNREIEQLSILGQASLAKRCIWATETRREFARLLDRENPDLVHVHNTFVMISPSLYSACHDRGIPVVQTLHNFRLLCPAATFYRDGKVCEECAEHSLWRGIYHGCFRDSRPATATVALMLACHRRLGTWNEHVNCYIALTEFSRNKFIAAGLPADKIVVKPNFLDPDPGERKHPGNYALFVGRLSPEKGVSTLLEAWKQLQEQCALHIVGDGPEREALEAQARQRHLAGVTFRGHLSREETIAEMKGAQFLVTPSVCYESFPMTFAESFACGTPVICSRLGGMREIVDDHRTGLHFTAGEAGSLAQTLEWAINHPRDLAEMGRAARREYETRYAARGNYSLLKKIYQAALLSRAGSSLSGFVSRQESMADRRKPALRLPVRPRQ